MNRIPRHHAMVDFQQHQERKWCVLEEDHEKVEKRADLLEGLLREMLEAYDDGVGREDEHGNNWEFPLWQKARAALAGQQQPDPTSAKNALVAATFTEDGRDASRLDFMLTNHRKVIVECLPGNRKAIYVEEGFIADKQYPSIRIAGDWSSGSPEDLAMKRKAIDAAIGQQGKEVSDAGQ